MGMRRFAGIGDGTRRATYLGAVATALDSARAEACRAMMVARHPSLNIDLRLSEAQGPAGRAGLIKRMADPDPSLLSLLQSLAQNQVQIAMVGGEELPTVLAPGLLLVAFGERGDPRDAVVDRKGRRLAELPAGSKVGVRSLRARAQLLAHFPELQPLALRCSTEEWLKRLDRGAADALLVPSNDLDRLGASERVVERLELDTFLPSPAQAGLGFVVRERDFNSKTIAAGLTHVPSAMACDAERALQQTLDAPEYLPLAAHAEVDGPILSLRAELRSLDGSKVLRAERRGLGSVADSVGQELAQELLDAGAQELLDDARAALAPA